MMLDETSGRSRHENSRRRRSLRSSAVEDRHFVSSVSVIFGAGATQWRAGNSELECNAPLQFDGNEIRFMFRSNIIGSKLLSATRAFFNRVLCRVPESCSNIGLCH